MRLSFCVDGYQEQVGVELRQHPATLDGKVLGRVHGRADLAAVVRQVARVLSLDHDGEGFVQVGLRDPVIGRLQAAAPGLRPPLFYSPYEAAAWAVLSARRPARQMAQVRRALSEAHGATFQLAGEQVAAFPTPEQILAVELVEGLTTEKVQRLHGVARAAIEGRLDADRLVALPPAEAMRTVQTIKGIGPFYAGLIVVRASGHADVLPESEPQSLAMAARLYGLAGPPTVAQFRAMAEPWRPFRTWAVVLIRAVGERVLGDSAQP